eukprot:TRINITY_DN7706_c0_g2_i2.p1 TRINITY_DN7706_c0_g2~~TRINITY_DN7706_c0_g2_i2.p1  ORF type:complete len:247 (+),score=30.30 TRINITY_DN7706_c0_g2_i2:79-819(+)
MLNQILLTMEYVVWKSFRFKNATIESGSFFIMLFIGVRFRLDLMFTNCVKCEDSRMCLADDPLLYCGFQDGSEEWKTMAYASIVDLVIWSLMLSAIFFSLIKSWKWQRGETQGVNSEGQVPWYVLFAEPWAKHLKGHSGPLRHAVKEFAEFADHLRTKRDQQDVWRRFILHVFEQRALMVADLANQMVTNVQLAKIRSRKASPSVKLSLVTWTPTSYTLSNKSMSCTPRASISSWCSFSGLILLSG